MDGQEELADVAGKNGRDGKEELDEREPRAIHDLAGREAAERRDARKEVTGQDEHEGREPGGKFAQVREARTMIEDFVAEKDDGKQDCRLLAEERAEKEKGAEEQRPERRGGGSVRAAIVEHGKEQEEGAEKFREGGDPGDGFGVHGMESEDEGRPEGEEWRVERDKDEINENDDGGVEKHVHDMPIERIGPPDLVFGCVKEGLEGAIIVRAVDGGVLWAASKGPDIAGEGKGQILGLEDEGVLEDLDAVVGDKAVAECGSVEGKGDQDEDDEVKGFPGARPGRRRNF